MADASGTPSPNFSIPTLNTSVDPPSGNGENTIVAALDTLLAKGFVVMSAKGDIVYSSAANVAARLPIGATGNVLTVAGGVPTWAAPAATTLNYRKNTAKAVNTTVAATDLLNGEITIAAGAMGTTGIVRLTAFGDWVNNSGGTVAPPRFQLLFGGTTIIDTGISGTTATSVSRGGWRIVAEIANLGVANAQATSFMETLALANGASTFPNNVFTTGEGYLEGIGVAGSTTNAAQISAPGVNPSTAVDTTAARALVLNVINGSANAAYETKLLAALVEVI